jgi:hypothetical protein
MLLIGLVVVTVWFAILVLAVALCRAAARADAIYTPADGPRTDRRPAREGAPALPVPRVVGQPTGAIPHFRLVH